MEKYIITKGSGNSTYEINAFDNALISSGIADYNLVKLSSILPPHCFQVTSVDLPKGEILHTAYGSFVEDSPKTTISAAVAIALPKDRSLPGVIMEAAGIYSIKTVEMMVEEMLQTAMGVRKIKEYTIQKESISIVTEEGFNCVFAAVSVW